MDAKTIADALHSARHRLILSGLADNPPKTVEDIEEAMDIILMYWFEKLADDDATRCEMAEEIAAALSQYLNHND